MGKNVSLFEIKYDMQNFRTHSTLNIYCGTTVRDCKISNDAFICKELIDIRDGLLSSPLTTYECKELLVHICTCNF